MSECIIKMIFDATIIANGAKNNANRSGLYMVAFNLLKQLAENKNLRITLFCTKSNRYLLECVLEKEFSQYKFNIIQDFPNNSFQRFYLRQKRIKSKLKKEGKFFRKTIYNFFLMLLSVLKKIDLIFYKKSLNIKQYNVIFSPVFAINPVIKSNKVKNIIFLHDTIPLILPEMCKGMLIKHSWFSKLIQNLNKDDFYITNSEATKKDFLRYFPQIDATKISKALLACDEKFKPVEQLLINEVKKKYGIPQNVKYILSLCTLDPRKNLIRAVKTFVEFLKKNNIDDMYFVLGGGHWKEFMGELEKEISDLGEYKDKIIKAGYVADEDLAPLYSGAEWFVYTSQYEGFGLPPLEAMSSGCPVITSNNSSLPEVVGDAGIMIDWDSDEQHIEAYEKYYFDKDLRNQNRQKGLERARLFSWGKCADEMIKLIMRV